MILHVKIHPSSTIGTEPQDPSKLNFFSAPGTTTKCSGNDHVLGRVRLSLPAKSCNAHCVTNGSLLLITEPLTRPECFISRSCAVFPSTLNFIHGEIVYPTILPDYDLTDVRSKLSSSEQELELLLPYSPHGQRLVLDVASLPPVKRNGRKKLAQERT